MKVNDKKTRALKKQKHPEVFLLLLPKKQGGKCIKCISFYTHHGSINKTENKK